MKYQDGDKVNVVSEEKLREIYHKDVGPGVVQDMYKYAGKTLTISGSDTDATIPFYDVEENIWTWSEDMFEES
jgi:hypothetical protein